MKKLFILFVLSIVEISCIAQTRKWEHSLVAGIDVLTKCQTLCEHSPLPSPPASEPAVPSGWVTAMPGLFSRAALNCLTA